jgi:EmrB/QacA subfamily drug resistance transporter
MHENTTSKTTALIVSAMSAFLTPFMVSSINILLPSIARDFGMNAMLMSWVVTSYILASAVFLVPFGRLSDIIGRKKIFFTGLCIFTMATFSISVIPAHTMLLIFLRTVQGFGSAMIFGTGMTIIVSVFPPSERGRVLGINVACVYLGLAVGPFIGGAMTQHFTWRSIFILTALIGIILIILVALKLKGEWAEARGEKFDIAGSVVYGLSLVCLMYGFSRLPRPWAFMLIAAGIGLFIVLVLLENRTEHPVLNFSVFRKNKIYTLATSSALINYSATFAVGFLMSLYLQTVKRMTPLEAGTVMLIQPALQTMFSPFAGRLADRKDPQTIASAGMGLTSAGLFMLIFTGRDTGLAYIMTCLSILGLGFAFFSSPNTTAAMNAAEKKYYGVASSLLATMRLLGQMLSMGISMIVFSVIIGSGRITYENASLFLRSVKIIFIIFAIMCFIGIFLKTTRGRKSRKST